jgi:hypothetical protein
MQYNLCRNLQNLRENMIFQVRLGESNLVLPETDKQATAKLH